MGTVDLVDAVQIADRYLVRLSSDAGVRLILLKERTEERDFGWVFYYGPEDVALPVAGNAPFIVDRKEKSIYPTGTALPTEVYLENYADWKDVSTRRSRAHGRHRRLDARKAFDL
jgi:hypothetical protein